MRESDEDRLVACNPPVKSHGWIPDPDPEPAAAPEEEPMEEGEGSCGTEDSDEPKTTKEKAAFFDQYLAKAMRVAGLTGQKVQKGQTKCKICKKECRSTRELKRHVKKSHEGKGRLKCEDENCDKTFMSREMLQAHMKREHEGSEEHKCNTCNKLFSTLKALKLHQNLHQASADDKCTFCHKAFKQRRYRLEHEVACELNPKRLTLQCKLCGSIFHQRKAFNFHNRKYH